MSSLNEVVLRNPWQYSIPIAIFMIAAPIGLIIAVLVKNQWAVNYPAGMIVSILVIAICCFAICAAMFVIVSEMLMMRVIVTTSSIEVRRPLSTQRIEIEDVTDVRYDWKRSPWFLRQRRLPQARVFVIKSADDVMYLSPRLHVVGSGESVADILVTVLPAEKCECVHEFRKRMAAGMLW